MSERPLTGYDNRDVVSGRPEEEVYVYWTTAVLERLMWVSCDIGGFAARGTGSR